MIITTKLTDKQMYQVSNLLMNCTDKMDMFDHLIDIGLNGFHALHMSNSFSKITVSFSVLPLIKQQQRKTYHYENGSLVLIEV